MAQNYTNTQDGVYSAVSAVSVTSTSSTVYNKSRGVWIGATNNYDFSFDGTNWITFNSCSAGSCLGIQVVAARKSADLSAPASGEIVFLY